MAFYWPGMTQGLRTDFSVKKKYFKQECISVGCVPSATVAVSGGGCLSGGVCTGVGACLGGVHLPPTEFLAHACKNITFPQLLLRTVNIYQ